MSDASGAPQRVRVTADPDWYAPAGIALGIRVGDLVFTSGQGPIDEHGATVGKGDFEAQARQALANLALVLKNAGSGLDQVVKATVFVTDIARDQEAFARLRAEYFVPHTFAESFVQVASLADPDWLIEIEAVAVAG
ncbi:MULTISPECIES: RidA family protein [Streptomyces]|uniref:Enamine deaminase RidA n=1 Tax=Streptomyces rubradiris TaxID=285531 RepID=A0ABQ3R9U4_STRRR|nr:MULTISPECIES: RidA family protein [Streptomyces]MDN3265322.1 RidA family protein [Streptomyces sp. CSDS2]GHH00572.1 enamine deaminase RidA [Streptomyces rubradiris]GHI52620.1 enamine deaminase RidA [Streptomyces rubradiris]